MEIIVVGAIDTNDVVKAPCCPRVAVGFDEIMNCRVIKPEEIKSEI